GSPSTAVRISPCWRDRRIGRSEGVGRRRRISTNWIVTLNLWMRRMAAGTVAGSLGFGLVERAKQDLLFGAGAEPDPEGGLDDDDAEPGGGDRRGRWLEVGRRLVAMIEEEDP